MARSELTLPVGKHAAGAAQCYIQPFTADAAGVKPDLAPHSPPAGRGLRRNAQRVETRFERVHGVARGMRVLGLNHAHSRRLAADSPTKSGTRGFQMQLTGATLRGICDDDRDSLDCAVPARSAPHVGGGNTSALPGSQRCKMRRPTGGVLAIWGK